jgi:hypothetical protein
MFYAEDHRTRWGASWDDIDEIGRPPHFHQKTMFAIFVNGTVECTIAILPEGPKTNSIYFIECVLRPLTEICCPQGRMVHEKRIMLHFDNAPVHSTERVQESLANFGFRRTEHPPYSPDLTPYAFFLFGAMKQARAGQYFDAIGHFFMAAEAFLGGLSVDFLQTVCQEWIRRLQLCHEGGGESDE